MAEAKARRRIREVPCHVGGVPFADASEAVYEDIPFSLDEFLSEGSSVCSARGRVAMHAVRAIKC